MARTQLEGYNHIGNLSVGLEVQYLFRSLSCRCAQFLSLKAVIVPYSHPHDEKSGRPNNMNSVATATKWRELSLAATFTQPFSSTLISQENFIFFFYYSYKVPQIHVKSHLFINSSLLPKDIFTYFRTPSKVWTQPLQMGHSTVQCCPLQILKRKLCLPSTTVKSLDLQHIWKE